MSFACIRAACCFGALFVAFATLARAASDTDLSSSLPPGLVPSKETVNAGGTDWPAFFEGTVTWTQKEEWTHGGIPAFPTCLTTEQQVTFRGRLVSTGLFGGAMSYEAVEGTWEGSATCTGRHEWTLGDGEVCNWEMTGSEAGAGTFPAEESGVFLFLYPSQEAHLSFSLTGGQAQRSWTYNCSIGGQGGATSFEPLWATGTHDASLVTGSWIGEGEDLSVMLSGSSRWEHSVNEGVWYQATWLGGFGPRQLVLAVEPAGYAIWMPQAGPTERDAGNTIALRARLRFTDGTDADVDAEQFTFTLTDVSRVPGTALNRPLGGALTDADLQFDPATNSAHTVAADRLSLTAAGGREATATATAFDWGAWGTVRVTATLQGGLTLTGTLDGQPGQEDIRLPKRTASSRIADAWKQQHGVSGRDDDADDEVQPEGDKNAGDGLTLYEEYRGFYANGTHRTADPLVKDLFIFDEVGGVSKRAIARFARHTGLNVHHEFRDTEYRLDRVVNFNHGGAPHVVDQHGILMIRVEEDRGYAVAAPVKEGAGPGTPGTIRAVEIPRNVLPGGQTWRDAIDRAALDDYMASTIAHELGHAVSIWHHGEDDRPEVVWRARKTFLGAFERDANGQIVIEEVGTGPIRVLTEAGQAVTPRVIQATGELVIDQMGVPGGQHSGDESCFMRYDNAGAYVSTSDPAVRYFGFAEKMGTGLCVASTGTGVNDGSRSPQSRYGTASRGACQHQILVNDRYAR